MLSTQFCPICGAANEAAQIRCFACGQALNISMDASTATNTPLLHERYQLGAMLGSGGFSTVYRARDVQTERDVAIKQINLHGLSAEEAIEATDTFNREANVLSSLHHPQIPQIYDQFSDQEHWYLVLQYLEGPTLETYLETRAIQSKPLQFDEVLEMALQLGEVLNYLHTRQPPIIFRDLKPSNIIRTPPKGTLCLVDFGIARRFRAGQKRDTQALGSPGYAAPEQYGRAQTTPRSDIYSLGALLHFLLSGDDPAESSPGLKQLRPHYKPGEERLGELVQRMLSLDPEQRPGDMGKVISELKAIQPQRAPQLVTHVWQPPIPQNQPSTSPRWQKWQQVQGQVPSSPPASQTHVSRQRGPGRRKVLIGLGGALAAAGVGGGIWWLYPRSTSSPVRQHTASPGQRVSTFWGHSDSVRSVAWSPDSKHIVSAAKDKTVQVWVATTAQILFLYQGHTDIVNSVAWSPGGRYIATGSDDKTVQVWDAVTGTTLFTYQGHTFSVTAIAWSPDGKRIASGSDDATVRVWDVTTGKTLLIHQEQDSLDDNNPPNAVSAVTWSPDGKYIASGSLNKNSVPYVWDATTGEINWGASVAVFGVNAMTWSPDSKRIAAGSFDSTAAVWDITDDQTTSYDQSLETSFDYTTNTVNAVTWSPDGQYVASGAIDKTVQVWNPTPDNGNTVLTYQQHTAPVNAVAWSPNGKYIVSGSDDKTVQVWYAP